MVDIVIPSLFFFDCRSIMESSRQYRSTKRHRHARALALIKQFHRLLHRIGHTVRRSPYGHVSRERSPRNVHHDPSALGKRPYRIVSPPANDGEEAVGVIFEVVIVGGDARVELATPLHTIYEDGIVGVVVWVEATVVEIAYWDGASHVVELGIHLGRGDEHQLVTDRYDELHHEDELALHLVRRSIHFFVVPRLHATYAEGGSLHPFGETNELRSGREQFS
mmetsp:Transcript_41826/g.75331  ORF Transcript_41826/g.75331 Transcript_41826/m.75331 type:complete len:222 (+) Transcript_41826:1178-1843(+)